MPKFSIIIPFYNVEKYLERTLKSLFKSTYKDFEVILINDNCTDNSMEIAKKFPVKIISLEKHLGVSASRNAGIKKAKGEYLIFLDSDDSIEKDLLKKVSASLDNNPDLVRYQARTIINDEKTDYHEIEFTGYDGEKAFEQISKFHFVESVWCYAIKKEYYLKNNFTFKEGTIHEDFGLTPLIIIKAATVNCLDFIGYNYYRRKGSIMNTEDYEWTQKKVKDFYTHYKFLIKSVENLECDTKTFKSFVANSMLKKICELKQKEYQEYLKKLKDENILENILADTLKRKIKKDILKVSPKLFYNLF